MSTPKRIGVYANQKITFKNSDGDKFTVNVGLNSNVPGWVTKTDHYKLAISGLNPLIKPYEAISDVKDADIEKHKKQLEEAKKIADDEKAKAIQEKDRADAAEKELAELKASLGSSVEGKKGKE